MTPSRRLNTSALPAIMALSLLSLTACGDKDGARVETVTPPQDARMADPATSDSMKPMDDPADMAPTEMAPTEMAPTEMAPTEMAPTDMAMGQFDVLNSSGNAIGTVKIRDVTGGVDVSLDVTAIPAGTHAIHFHENGTCDGPDFKSAGGHYNPKDHMHGFDADTGPKPHAGDMRNFEAPQSGVVTTTLQNERVSLSNREGMAPLRDANGTALIIHAAADDYKSQPSGAAGARIACAVIK